MPSESHKPGAMPAEFGTATATFLIVASMVGAGVLTTSGYTVLFVGSNQASTKASLLSRRTR